MLLENKLEIVRVVCAWVFVDWSLFPTIKNWSNLKLQYNKKN